MNINRKTLFNYIIKLIVVLIVLRYVPYSKNNISHLAVVLVILILSCVLVDNIVLFNETNKDTCNKKCAVENFEDTTKDVDISIESSDDVNVEVMTKVETDTDVKVEKKEVKCNDIKENNMDSEGHDVSTNSNKHSNTIANNGSKSNGNNDNALSVRKEIEEINNLKAKLAGLLDRADKRSKYLNRNDTQYPEYDNDMDFHSVPVPKHHVSKDYEYGFSYIPPEKWYGTAPLRPPVCKTDSPNIVQPVYLSDVADLKEWNNYNKLLQPDRIDISYIQKRLNQLEEKINA